MKPIATAILSAIIFCSCNSITGSGNIITQTRSVGQIEGVKASGSIDVEVTNDVTQLVKVEADDNIIPYIITSLEDGVLNVHYKSHMSFTNTHAKVYVSAQTLKKLSISGSGDISSRDTLKNAEQIDFTVSGSGDINALVDAPHITANIGGSGTITLLGRTKDFNCNVGGSGDIKANKLLSENTNASVSGSGSAHIFASVHLVAKVSGSGDIYYSGRPSSPEIHTSGSGSIQAEK
jgi:hypothetical protein